MNRKLARHLRKMTTEDCLLFRERRCRRVGDLYVGLQPPIGPAIFAATWEVKSIAISSSGSPLPDPPRGGGGRERELHSSKVMQQ